MASEFEEARAEFKALENKVYLNWAGTGPMPSSSVEAVKRLLNAIHEMNGSTLPEMRHEIPGNAKGELAKLLSAEPESIAISGTSTTQGVQGAFSAVNPGKGDSIVTCDLQYVLTETEMQKWREKGVTVKIVRNHNGTFEEEDFASAIDHTTKVVFLDSVTWINGYKFDINGIAKIAHENGAVMMTDSIQHVGEAVLDTRTFGADIVVGSAQKWLCNMLGVGYTYVSKEIAGVLERTYYGYTNTDEPEGGWPAYFTDLSRKSFQDFSFRAEPSSMLEHGGSLSNLAGLAALAPSLRLMNGIGAVGVQSRVLELKKYLVEELESMGMKILPPYEMKNQTGITTFETGIGHDHDVGIVEKLHSAGIEVSYRTGGGIGGIRVSTHYVNNEDDIEKFLTQLRGQLS